MQKLIYVPPWLDVTDPSRGVTIGISHPYIIGSIRGIGGVETELYTADAPGLPGSPVYGARLRPRTIIAPLHVGGQSRADMYALRRELAGMLTPAQSTTWEGLGRLYYYNDDGAYWIPAVPQNSPEYTERLANFNRAEVRFYCPDPFWRGIERHSVHLSYNQPLFEWPFEFPCQAAHVLERGVLSLSAGPNTAVQARPASGIASALAAVSDGSALPVEYGMIGYQTTAVNHGTTATPVEVYVYSKPLHNVTVTNCRTGEYIRVNRVVSEGDILYINTSLSAPEISIIHPDGSREQAFHFIDPGNELWQLHPGENIITYSGEEDNLAAEIDLFWYDQFAGL